MEALSWLHDKDDPSAADVKAWLKNDPSVEEAKAFIKNHPDALMGIEDHWVIL